MCLTQCRVAGAPVNILLVTHRRALVNSYEYFLFKNFNDDDEKGRGGVELGGGGREGKGGKRGRGGRGNRGEGGGGGGVG